MAGRPKKDKMYMGNPNVPSRGAEFEYTEEMLSEIQRCKEDILYFAENYFTILIPGKGKEKIRMFPAQRRILQAMKENRFFVLMSSRQVGKALALDTPILTPTGWTTMGELKVGDVVYGKDGMPCNVTYAYETRYDRKCFEVEFDNGEKIVADAEHNWYTQSKTERKRKTRTIGSVKTTQEIFDTLTSKSGEPNHRIPSCINGLINSEKDLRIPPYVLGLWLGDGASEGPRITVGKRDIEETIKNLEEYNTQYTLVCKQHGDNYLINLGMLSGRKGFRTETSLSQELREMGFFSNKHIPTDYMLSSRGQRLELLRGLMDSDGYINKRGLATFYNTNLKLAIQVKELVESLGYKTVYNTFIPTCNGINCSECAEVVFTPREYVCKLSFKTKRIKLNDIDHPESNKRNQWHYIKSVREVESVPVRCIEVDSSDHLFLAGKTLIPTHNSTLMTIFLLWRAIFFGDERILLVANKEATAIEIFGRIRLAYELLPNWLKSPVDGEYGKTSMKLENDSRISISTTTGTAARGQSVSILVIDEAAFIEEHLMDPFWASVFPIVSASDTSKVFMCSTPNGTGNLFHTTYTQAVEGKNGWAHDKILWNEVPGRTQEWADKIRSGLASQEKWDQEYNCFFLNTGTTSMDESLYRELKRNICEPRETLMDGKYKIWEHPNPDNLYVVGVDVSEGVGGDYSVIKVLDITDLQEIIEVAEYYDNTIPVSEFTARLYEILGHWGNPLVCIERNNQGGQVADRIGIDLGYPRIVNYGSKIAGRKSFELLGMVSQRNTKYHAVANARYFYSDRRSVVFKNEQSLEEIFKDFVKVNDTWQAASGKHDDRTMATIWALMILDREVCERWFTIDELDLAGKPLKISILDYGIKYFESPTSIYTNENVDKIENSMLNPMVFGAFGEADDEMAALMRDGWKFLQGGSPYIDPKRTMTQDQYDAMDRWFT